MYKFEMNLKLSQTTVITFCTLIGVAFTTVALKSYHFDLYTNTASKHTEALAVDMDLTIELNRSANAHTPNIESHTMFDEPNPDLMIFKWKNAKKEAPKMLNDFFSQLSAQRIASVSRTQLKSAQNDKNATSTTEETINYHAMKDRPKELPTSLVAKVNHTELKKIIASNQQVFQRCYEDSLLKDELLSGNASIVLNIGKKADVSFKGVGQETIKNELRKCLSQKAVAMDFSNQYRGKAVKFSLFFNN
jgi:hypothetical protein